MFDRAGGVGCMLSMCEVPRTKKKIPKQKQEQKTKTKCTNINPVAHLSGTEAL
jgi:hypothetical protein